MAINLDKNKSTLLSAWEDVVNDKTSTDWALFSYEGKTFDLKVVSKGDGGLSELIEDLSSGKIMYAFCRVLDPNTSLPKFVLINWQGEAAPIDKKGKCANHFADVQKFFKGSHVTINARTEDDVEEMMIIEKVSKSTASAFNFKARSKPEATLPKPVASVYKRVIPTAEINPAERDKFWEKEEAEEKQRLETEHKKADDVRKKLDEERKAREIEEAKTREERVKERMRSISEIREAERRSSNASSDAEVERLKWERQVVDDQHDESERRLRSESLRNTRKKEAEELIAQRNVNARAVFEQNSSAGQMNHRKPSLTLENNNLPRPDLIPSTPPEELSPEETRSFSPPISEPVAADDDIQVANNEYLPQNEVEETQNWEEHTVATNGDHVDQQPELLSQDHGLCARALYDYQAADETEISFDPDDIISHIDQIDEGWWQGMAPNGVYGLFPANYVELLD